MIGASLMRYLAMAAAAGLGSLAAFGQMNGSISGVVVGEDGLPITVAHVYAGTIFLQGPKAPPTRLAKVAGSVAARPDGSFTISNLAAGSYALCAQTSIPGWLDPCHFAPAVSPVALEPGKALSGVRIVMAKGAILQVRIDDPGTILPATAAASAALDVEVLVRSSNNLYYHSRIVSADATGRNHEITVPFGTSQSLIVRSRQFVLKDPAGAAIPVSGHVENLQIPNGAAAQAFRFTVSGKAH